DPENEYLSDGITDELIDALAKIEGLRVASRTSVFSLKNKPQDVRAIGALLGTSVVLEGTVRKSGAQLRVTAQLTSTDDGRLLWSQRYDRELADVFALQDEIAQTIVATLRAKSFGDPAPRHKRYTESVTAYGLYLRGRHAWNKRTSEGVAEAIDFFEQAIASDPRYALAYTGLSDAYALHVDYRSVAARGDMQEALIEAHTAQELDPVSVSARRSLGYMYYYARRYDRARHHVARALTMAPTAEETYRVLGLIHVMEGAQREAETILRDAVALPGSSEYTLATLGYALGRAGQLSEAREILHSLEARRKEQYVSPV